MAKIRTYTLNGQLVAEREVNGLRTDYLVDALGSVVCVTDPSGSASAQQRYKPYGTSLSISGRSLLFSWVGSFGYLSGVEVIQGSYYVRNRFYDSRIGRWCGRDPLWPNEPAYAYAFGNPTTVTDPSGLSAECFNHPCGESAASACAYVYNNAGSNDIPEIVRLLAGTVVCCNGHAYVCMFATPKGERPGITDCTRQHENYHKAFSNCSGEDFGFPSPGSSEECGAYTTEINCLKDHLSRECSALTGDAKAHCIADYQKAIRAACLDSKDMESCNPFLVHAICATMYAGVNI